MDAVEFVEDFLYVLFLDALAVVADGEAEVLALVPCADMDIDGLVCLTIFHGIVQQVGDGILEVHLVHEDGRVNGFYLGVDLAACMFYAEIKGCSSLLQKFVEVELFLLEGGRLSVEHGSPITVLRCFIIVGLFVTDSSPSI